MGDVVVAAMLSMGYMHAPGIGADAYIKPIGFGAFVVQDGCISLVWRSYSTGEPFVMCRGGSVKDAEDIAHFEHIAIGGRGSVRHGAFDQRRVDVRL